MASSPVIDPARLSDLLAAGPVSLLDVRWQLGGPPGHEEFLRGHLPGAAYVDLESDLADPPGARGRHPLPDPDRFVSAMRRCGVRAEVPVVAYDAVGGTSAARCWWLLRHHGHREVMVLDGGLDAWVAAAGPLETGEGTVEPGDFTGGPGSMPVLDADGAARVAREGVLVDARAPERFRGAAEPVDPVPGHIPGAVNVPTAVNLDERGRFRPAAELAVAYELAGVTPSRRIGVYCGSGVTACHDVLALEVLGVGAALYPGSWSEWVRDRRRRVATGR